MHSTVGAMYMRLGSEAQSILLAGLVLTTLRCHWIPSTRVWNTKSSLRLFDLDLSADGNLSN